MSTRARHAEHACNVCLLCTWAKMSGPLQHASSTVSSTSQAPALHGSGESTSDTIQVPFPSPSHLQPPIPTSQPTQPTSILLPALFVLLRLSQGTTQAARPLSSAEQALKPHEGAERGEGGESRLMLAPARPHMITVLTVCTCVCVRALACNY